MLFDFVYDLINVNDVGKNQKKIARKIMRDSSFRASLKPDELVLEKKRRGTLNRNNSNMSRTSVRS